MLNDRSIKVQCVPNIVVWGGVCGIHAFVVKLFEISEITIVIRKPSRSYADVYVCEDC